MTNRHGHCASSQLYSRLTSIEPCYVTWSVKTGLIIHDRKSNFFTQIQSYVSALLDSVPDLTCDSWSVSTGCFSLVLSQTV